MTNEQADQPTSRPADRPISLHHGDNLTVLRELVRENTTVDFAYLDPPFFSGATYRDQKTDAHAFDDRWPDMRTYLDTLSARLELVFTLLASHGSFVLHLDPTIVHHAKVRCDQLFGQNHFAGEIIWRYRRWPSKTPNLQSMHDVLLRYVKDPTAEPRFVQHYEPLAPSTVKTWGSGKQNAVVEGGRRKRSSTLAEPSPGAPLSDVWTDIGVIAPVSKERTGYPTQKPEKLLRRLIGVFSYEGDTVLDPYMGSGTTLAVARAMGRRGIGIDESEHAVRVARARLGSLEPRASSL